MLRKVLGFATLALCAAVMLSGCRTTVHHRGTVVRVQPVKPKVVKVVAPRPVVHVHHHP